MLVGTLFQVKKQYDQLTPIGMGAVLPSSAVRDAQRDERAIKKVVNSIL